MSVKNKPKVKENLKNLLSSNFKRNLNSESKDRNILSAPNHKQGLGQSPDIGSPSIEEEDDLFLESPDEEDDQVNH